MQELTNLAFIGMGSNKSWLGKPPDEILNAAARALTGLGKVSGLSRLYASPAWPDPSQPRYTNAVASLVTSREPEALLAGLQAMEAGFGRLRSDDPSERYAPRTLDLDLIAMGDERRQSDELILPHPRLAERDFVLLPLRDLAPGFVHPVTGRTIGEMISRLGEISARCL